MNLARIARTTSAAVVAGVAAVASYSHMRDLAARHGQTDLLAALLPLSVDGLLIVASVVMADDRATGRPVRMSARLSFVAGVAASLAANVLAAPAETVARVVSAWPALALLLVVEMLAGGKPRLATVAEPADARDTMPATLAEPADEPAPVAVAVPLDSTAVDTDQPDIDALLASLLPVGKIEPERGEVPMPEFVPPAGNPADLPDDLSADEATDPREAAREAYRQSVDQGDPLSGAAVGRLFDMSPRWGVDRVNEVRAELNGRVPAETP